MEKELLRESLLLLNAGEGEGDTVDGGESYPPPDPDPITFLSRLGLSSLTLAPALPLSTPSLEEARELVLDGFCLKIKKHV